MSPRASTPEALMSKARVACTSAKVLLEAGDTDGAASRAYYAMFDAARAALILSGCSTPSERTRTHSGLIAAFGHDLVKPGLVPKDLGRWLNRAHEMRLVADYNGESVDLAQAQELLLQAEGFVAAMRDRFMPEGP